MNAILNAIPETIEMHAVWSTNAVFVDNAQLDLLHSQEIKLYSHIFTWGYAGSAPTQLALALLLRYLPAENAVRYCEALMRNLIARLPENSFIRTVQLRDHMARILYEVDGSVQPELF
jgi:hypothetical protein